MSFNSVTAEQDQGKGDKADRLKSLKTTMKTIRNEHGEESITILENDDVKKYPHWPSGNIGIDISSGIGGIPKGRIIEIYSPESVGKTTLTLKMIASVQKNGGVCAFIDAEHSYDPKWANKNGINNSELLFSQPDNGEMALEIVDDLVTTSQVDLIVVDSTSSLVPKAELEGDMGDSHMGLQARLLSQALRKITGSLAKTNTTVIFISQIRMKIGCVSPETKIKWTKEKNLV